MYLLNNYINKYYYYKPYDMKIFTILYEGNKNIKRYVKKGDIVAFSYKYHADKEVVNGMSSDDDDNPIANKRRINWFESEYGIQPSILGRVVKLKTENKDIIAVVEYGQNLQVELDADELHPQNIFKCKHKHIVKKYSYRAKKNEIVIYADKESDIKVCLEKAELLDKSNANMLIKNIVQNYTKLFDFDYFTDAELESYNNGIVPKSVFDDADSEQKREESDVVKSSGQEPTDSESTSTKGIDRLLQELAKNINLEEDKTCLTSSSSYDFVTDKAEVLQLLSIYTASVVRLVEEELNIEIDREAFANIKENAYYEISKFDMKMFFRDIK